MQSENDRVWAEKMQLKSLYFKDGPVKGDHQYSDKLYREIVRRPRGAKPVTYFLISDPEKDLLEYVYSIRKPNA
jgi:hypothetical protein